MEAQPKQIQILEGQTPNSLVNLLASMGFFFLVSTPSIKLIFSHPVINFLPVLMLLMVTSLTGRSGIITVLASGKNILVALFYFIVFFYIYYMAMPGSYQDLENFFRYIFFFLSLILVVINSRYIKIDIVIKLIIVWGTFIAGLKILGYLHLDAAKGQNYLTVGLPMGAGLTAILLNIVQFKGTRYWRFLLNIFTLLVIMTGLLLSQGRSNLLYPFAALSIYFFILILKNKKTRFRNLFWFFTIGAVVAFSYITLSSKGEYMVFNRLNRAVESVDEESRYGIWTRTVDLILENPFGYGVDSYNYFLSNYPHNIFLEITLSLGIIGLIFLCVLLRHYIRLFAFMISKADLPRSLLTGACVACYFFMVWNTSFDFATSYIPLAMLLLFCVQASSLKKLSKAVFRNV